MQISVVLATYNGEKFINSQLDSIIKQSVLPDEIIISDDCSSDKTWEILQEYELNYPSLIRIIQNEINLGYEKNFWQVLNLAKGDIIFLSDQDDVWLSNKIEKMINIMQREKNILALSTSYELIDELGHKYSDIRSVSFRDDEKLKQIEWKDFVKHPKYPGMTMAIRKKLLSKIPKLNMEQMPAHDWLLNLFSSLESSMYFLDAVLTQYRQHTDNVIGSSASSGSVDTRMRRIYIISNMKTMLDKTLMISDLKACKLYSSADVQYMKKISELCKRRIELIKKRSFVRLIIYDLGHYPYLTKRSIIGDIYALFGTTEKGKI